MELTPGRFSTVTVDLQQVKPRLSPLLGSVVTT